MTHASPYTRFLFFLITSGATVAAQEDLLRSGPMLAHVDVAQATVWLQTSAPAEVRIEYQAEGRQKRNVVVATQAQDLNVARCLLSDLVENTSYTYRVFINGREAHFDYPLTFKTQSHWWYRHDPPEINFALGSCFYVNDPPSDRPGTPYGAEFEILDVIYEKNPDFMLWLGDNIYLRESDFFSATRMERRYQLMRSMPELQPLLARSAHYAIWDDHDYGPNNSHRSYQMKGTALSLFKAYWGNPSYGLPDVQGIFGKLSWGDLEFFMLDDRYHRAPNESTEPDKPFLGAQQLQWLKDELVASDAGFKIVVVGNQVLNTYSRHESYHSYVNEYAEFMNWINQNPIHGLIFLTGDRHHTELLKLNRPHSYPLYEFTSSPLTSGVGNPRGVEMENPLRVPNTLVKDKRNFGLINVTGPRKKRLMKLQTWDSTGKLRWEYTIKQEDLYPKK